MKIFVVLAMLRGQTHPEPVGAFSSAAAAEEFTQRCVAYRNTMPEWASFDYAQHRVSFADYRDSWNDAHPAGRGNSDADVFKWFETTLTE